MAQRRTKIDASQLGFPKDFILSLRKLIEASQKEADLNAHFISVEHFVMRSTYAAFAAWKASHSDVNLVA